MSSKGVLRTFGPGFESAVRRAGPPGSSQKSSMGWLVAFRKTISVSGPVRREARSGKSVGSDSGGTGGAAVRVLAERFSLQLCFGPRSSKSGESATKSSPSMGSCEGSIGSPVSSRSCAATTAGSNA
ncbi:MAG: hypothetical protein ACK5EA_22395 [Planctomycetaceae bacterium]